MQSLPKELKNIIYDYKKDIEKYERQYSYALNDVSRYCISCDIFFLNIIKDGYSQSFYDFVEKINKKRKVELSYKDVVNKLRITTGWVDWDDIGSGKSERYTKIEYISYDVIDKYKKSLNWRLIGSGICNYTKKENLPKDFVERFKEYIIW